MTSLLDRPARTGSRRRTPPLLRRLRLLLGQGGPETRPVGAAAAAAAVWAAVVGLAVAELVVLVVWATAGGGAGGAAGAVRSAAQAWLLAHHTGIHLAGGHLGLLPLGLVALPWVPLWFAGRWVARETGVEDLQACAVATGLFALTYAVLAALVSSVASSDTARPAPVQALFGGLVLAVLAGGWAMLREAGLGGLLLDPITLRGRSVLVGACGALLTLLATGTLLLAGALVAHAGRVQLLEHSLDAGFVGGLALLLVGLLLLPNAVIWGVAYTLGPGFAVGAGTSVSPVGVHLGAVPALPLLGVLPENGPGPLLALPLLVGPLVAGVVAGLLVVRRLPAFTAESAALWGAATGPVAGLAVGVAALLSGGPAGAGRMATLGPSPWQVALAATLEVGVAAAASAYLWTRRTLR
jgi:hypothetical protein